MESEFVVSMESIMRQSFDWVAYGTLALAPLVFGLLFYINAPYGRHIRRGWGPQLDNRLGWFLMESPAVIVFGLIMALVFNTTNAYLNAWSIASHASRYNDAWLSSPQLLTGLVVFFAGMALNKISDQQLARLSRNKGSSGTYQIPHGGFFRWVSCPNYLGEIIQWTGWAIATWALAGWIFAIWTMANLVPRAVAHHRWYRQTFEDYPQDRRALIPLLF